MTWKGGVQSASLLCYSSTGAAFTRRLEAVDWAKLGMHGLPHVFGGHQPIYGPSP